MEADEASMTSLLQQSEDDFQRNKVADMQIELGLSLFRVYFPLWKPYTVLLPVSELLGSYMYMEL